MKLRNFLQPELIFLDMELPDRDSAIQFLANQLDLAGKLNDKAQFIEAVMAREAQGPTALGEQLAVPHGKSAGVKETAIAIARLKNTINWEGVDGPEPVKLVVMLAIPLSQKGDTHINILTDLTTRLVDDDVREALMSATSSQEFLDILSPQGDSEAKSQPIPHDDKTKTVVCVTACPTGIAHTYMAAEYLEKAGKKLGVRVFVEKQGSKGTEGALTPEQLNEADAAIFAADVAVKGEERFAHLPILRTKVAEPIRQGEEVIRKALALPAKTEKVDRTINSQEEEKAGIGALVKQSLLTGVSYAIPFIAAGGIMIALAIAFAPMTASGPDFSTTPVLKLIGDIGGAAFGVLLPLLAGYIAYGMAGRPGLVAGFVGGSLAGTTGAGFLGALIAGLLAGFVVRWIKDWKVPKAIEPIMPILIIPILSSLVVGTVMLKVIGVPIAGILEGLGQWLQSMGDTNAVLLGLILGCMIAIDMGGPINKAAFFFGAAMIQEGNYAVMGAVAAAICVPPISMGLATKLSKTLWSEQEREAGTAAILMGLIGITEGAIPFAVADPLRVIPSIMTGSAVAGAIAMYTGVGNHAPHGGPIVLPVIDGRLMYIVAIIVGVVISAFMINALRSMSKQTQN